MIKSLKTNEVCAISGAEFECYCTDKKGWHYHKKININEYGFDDFFLIFDLNECKKKCCNDTTSQQEISLDFDIIGGFVIDKSRANDDVYNLPHYFACRKEQDY